MSAKLATRKDVLAHIDEMYAWWRDFSIDDLLLDGDVIDAEIAGSIIDWEIKRAISGPPTLDITCFDPDRILQGTVLPQDDEVIFAAGEVMFALQQVRTPAGSANIQLVSEALIAEWLKRYDKYRKVRRGTMTRAEFIFSMAKEIREGTVKAYIPDLHQVQPVEKSQKSKAAPGKRGVTKSDHLTVKGRPASPAQLRTMNDVLDAAAKYSKNKRDALICCIMCIIVENDATNDENPGDKDSRFAFQQRKSQGWRGDLSSIDRQVKNFLIDAPTEPLLTLLKNRGGRTLGELVQATQLSARPDEYDRWKSEATKAVKAYLGKGGGSQRAADAKYEFARGEPGKRETTWAAALRLGDDVDWRFFVDHDFIFYLNDEDLVEAAPVTVLSEEMPGIKIGFDYDQGKKVNTVSVESDFVIPGIMPGLAIDIEGHGHGDGRYLIESQTRKARELGETLEAIRPGPARKEPAGESSTTTRSRSGRTSTQTAGWVSPLKKMPAASGKFGEQRPGHLHAGIDFPCGVGTPVRAASGGKVTHAGSEGGYGNSVVIEHTNGYSTRYAHLSSIGVRVGQRVDSGDTIARSGNTGHSFGPHLHFELLRNGHQICPASKVPGISKGLCVRQSI